MARNIKLIVYPFQDIEKAKAFYGKFLRRRTECRRRLLYLSHFISGLRAVVEKIDLLNLYPRN